MTKAETTASDWEYSEYMDAWVNSKIGVRCMPGDLEKTAEWRVNGGPLPGNVLAWWVTDICPRVPGDREIFAGSPLGGGREKMT